jgi:hypothetical protein
MEKTFNGEMISFIVPKKNHEPIKGHGFFE